MNEAFEPVLELSKTFWRKRWNVMVVTFLVCLIGWPVVYLLPNVYEANAKVYLDTESMLRPLLKGLAVQSDVRQEFVNVARRTLLSRPNMAKVARETDLDLQAKTPTEMEVLLQTLGEEIEVSGSGRENIYHISYRNSNPQIAKKVVESLLNIFMAGALDASRQDTDVTQRFLDDQIKDYQRRLEEAEAKLKVFKQKNIGMMPTESGGYFQKLDDAKLQMDTARLQLNETKMRRDELRSQLSQMEAGQEVVIRDESLAMRIAALETRLNELLLVYTEQHPDVIAVRRNLADLMAAQGGNKETVPMSREALSQSRSYHDLKVELGRAEADAASLEVRYEEFRRRVRSLQSLIDTIPEVEAELVKLSRDYEINKANYEALVARRESAKISQDAEMSTDQIQFKVVEPPHVPIIPAAPKRPLLITMVLIFGIGAGLFYAYAMATIKPTVNSVRHLRSVTGLPVLGAVTYIQSPGKRAGAMAKNGSFWLSCIVLLIGYAIIMYMQAAGQSLLR